MGMSLKGILHFKYNSKRYVFVFLLLLLFFCIVCLALVNYGFMVYGGQCFWVLWCMSVCLHLRGICLCLCFVATRIHLCRPRLHCLGVRLNRPRPLPSWPPMPSPHWLWPSLRTLKPYAALAVLPPSALAFIVTCSCLRFHPCLPLL